MLLDYAVKFLLKATEVILNNFQESFFRNGAHISSRYRHEYLTCLAYVAAYNI